MVCMYVYLCVFMYMDGPVMAVIIIKSFIMYRHEK